MKFFRKPLFTGFAPHITLRDTLGALSFLLFPWKWGSMWKGAAQKEAEAWLTDYFDGKKVFLCDSGRSALFIALRAIGVGEGDEVLVQAYTCLVVINAISWTGATPVFVDITEDFTMDPHEARKKITDRTKALIIQHTFGTPADIDALLPFCKEHGVKVVEDCAHSLGVRHNGQLTGTFGDIGILSFGSDKVISCVRGGGLVVSDDVLAQKVRGIERSLPRFPLFLLLQHLMHYPVFVLGRCLYNMGIGKALLWSAQKLHVINRIVYPEEKKGMQMKGFPAQFPNALATILLNQLNELEQVNQHRKKIAALYNTGIHNPLVHKSGWSNESVYLRYTIQVAHAKWWHAFMQAHGVYLGFWYDVVVSPPDSDKEATGYHEGICPEADRLAPLSVNLPTERHISEHDAERIIRLINEFHGN